MDLLVDTWVQILLELKHEPIKLSLNCTIINKSSNLAFHLILQQKNADVFPKKTFIPMSRCMNCETICDTHCVSYITDIHPKRMILYCDKFECLIKTLQCYFHDMNLEKKYPYIRFSRELIWIPRTNGGFSSGKVMSQFGFKLNNENEPCIDVMLASEISEKIDDPPINESFELSKKVKLNDILKQNSQFFKSMNDEKLFTKVLVSYRKLQG